MPDDRWHRAQALQWMFFEQYSHEPYVAVARFWLAAAPKAELDGEAPSRSANGTLAGNAALAVMKPDWRRMTGSSARATSIADIALYGYTHAANEGGFDLTQYPKVEAWLARVAAEPGHIPL